MKKEDFNVTKEGLMTTIINRVSGMVLKMSDDEIKKLSKLVVRHPKLTKASISMAADLKCKMDWDIIITSLAILTMDSIDYGAIAKYITDKLPTAEKDYIIGEVMTLYAFLTSIIIENNRSEIIKVDSPMDSKYKLSIVCFRSLLNGEISLDVFHKNISEFMVSVIKEEFNSRKFNHLVV